VFSFPCSTYGLMVFERSPLSEFLMKTDLSTSMMLISTLSLLSCYYWFVVTLFFDVMVDGAYVRSCFLKSNS